MREATVPQPGILQEHPTLSVCMIVRDEEKMLPRCLKSVRAVADELVVVDTGSKDDTILIAKDFGAEVFHFEWVDDFAAARNESLRHAGGDWILQIDADEELLSDSISHLRNCMIRSTVLCYFIRCDNGPRCQEPRFVRVDRLFRNHPKLRYDRPYHESAYCSVQELIIAQPPWQVEYEQNVIIRHYGYERSKLSKKLGRGLRIMESHLKENPDDAIILTRVGGVYFDLGRYDKAEKYLNKAMQIQPDWPDINYTLGVILQQREKLDAAVRCYKKAVSSDPELAEAYANLGAAYIQQGKLDIGISELKRALGINPDLALAHSQLGLAYKKKGMLNESIAELREAVTIDPDVADAHVNLGVAYGQKGMLDESIAEHKLALALMPEDANAQTNLGVTYAEKGMLDEAIAQHKKAISIAPHFTAAYVSLGAAYHMKGMLDEAADQYQHALDIDANNADAHFNLGLVYEKKGIIDGAITEYKCALAINSELAEVHNNLAVAYYHKRNYKLAIQHCDKALEFGISVHPGFLEELKAYR